MPPKRQSLKSRAEPHKKKSGKPESMPLLNCQSKSSKLIPRRNYYITHSAFFQCLSVGSLSPSDCNVSVLQCPAAGAAQRTAVRLSYGLPSQAVLPVAAVICCRSSPCSAAGSTTRAAATGSTEPEGLRKLSGVAHHIDNDGKMVDFVKANKIADHFRDVPKLFLCGVHPGGVTEMTVCSACHDILLIAFAGLLLPGQRKTG